MRSKKYLSTLRSQKCLFVFFYSLGFTFKNRLHFNLIFVYGLRDRLRLFEICFCFAYNHPIISVPFVEKLSLFHKWCWHFVKISPPYSYRSISVLSNLIHWSICLSCGQYHMVLIIVALYSKSYNDYLFFLKIVLVTLSILFIHGCITIYKKLRGLKQPTSIISRFL